MPEEQSQLVTNAAGDRRISGIEKELSNQAWEAKWVRGVIVSILVVVVIAFIGLLFTVYGIVQQHLSAQTAAYQSLVDKVTEQNIKMGLLYQQCNLTDSRQTTIPQPTK